MRVELVLKQKWNCLPKNSSQVNELRMLASSPYIFKFFLEQFLHVVWRVCIQQSNVITTIVIEQSRVTGKAIHQGDRLLQVRKIKLTSVLNFFFYFALAKAFDSVDHNKILFKTL